MMTLRPAQREMLRHHSGTFPGELPTIAHVGKGAIIVGRQESGKISEEATMKLVSMIVLIATVTFGSAAIQSPKRQAAPGDCCQMVQQALTAAKNIKLGMTRRDVEKAFQLDGGLVFPTETRYTYADCPFIKIDVTFKSSKPDFGGGFDPADEVVQVSKPYLEGPFAD
jgi:hypothetical protein